jgi:hypothetical protein
MLFSPHPMFEAEVLATALPRDLRRCGYCGPISVISSFPALWQYNPHVNDVFHRGAGQVPGEVLQLPDPLACAGAHVLVQQAAWVAARVFPALRLTELCPQLLLGPDEKERTATTGIMQGGAFWLVCISGDGDWSTRWWDPKKWQQVIHTLSGDPQFPYVLQIDYPGAKTPSMRDCLSVVDIAKPRELVWLVHHSSGVATNSGAYMHMAAAMGRPCVAVLGGAASSSYVGYDARARDKAKAHIPEQYHKFLALLPQMVLFDAIGNYPCCLTDGCGLRGNGDRREGNCTDLYRPKQYDARNSMPQPRCLVDISPRKVAEAALNLQRDSHA